MGCECLETKEELQVYLFFIGLFFAMSKINDSFAVLKRKDNETYLSAK